MPPKTIAQKMRSPLSNIQLCSMLGCAEDDVILYSKLKEYSTIDELLPHDKSFKILLLEDKPRSGHYTALYRQGDLICYFNSYGDKPDRDMNCIPRLIRKMLGEDRPEITRLCADREIWYNHHKLQGEKSQVCGRYCMFFVSCLQMGFSPDQAIELLYKTKQNGGYRTFDEAVCSITP